MNDKSNAKLFVGRLPEGCTEKDLEDLFKTYGTVNQTDLIGKYGFVHMIKREEAEEAIKKLNNYNFMGSQLTVQFSTSKLSNTSGKFKNNGINRRNVGPNKRNSGPFRNNSYPQSRPQYNRFADPPPVPPNNFAPYYDDMNSYYREPYYPESEPFYRQNTPNMSSVPSYEAPIYGRGGPPPAPDYTRTAVPQIQPEMYGRGDGPYNRPLAYDFNRSIAPTEPPRNVGFGGPVRNGYGNTGGYANRGPAGAGNRAGVAPQLPPSARWQPY